jgi:ATP-dependent Lon protease
MTGEVTLRGRVLPVGGIKMKVLAAHRAGLKTVILPKRNQRDLEDVPAEIRKTMRFVMVDRIEEALDVGLMPIGSVSESHRGQTESDLNSLNENVMAMARLADNHH